MSPNWFAKHVLIPAAALSVSIFSAHSRQITYVYSGHSLVYEVVNETQKTCRTKAGTGTTNPGNTAKGTLTIPSTISDGADEYTVIEIGDFGFVESSNLTSIILPNTIQRIGKGAFGYTKIGQLELPNSVKEIDNDGFAYCSSMTSATLPNGLATLKTGAFRECKSLASIEIPNSVTTMGKSTFYYCTKLTSVKLSNSLKELDNRVFDHCTALTYIEIPDCITRIGESAFSGCSSLRNISFSKKLETIEKMAFNGCSMLSSIEFPNTLTSIGSSSFSGCSKLTEISIPNSVTELGGSAFSGCSGLYKINLPNSIKTIEGRLFSYCKNLVSIKIPDSATLIGELAFNSCFDLQDVYIGSHVSQIDSQAFRGCTNLKNFYCFPSEPPKCETDIFLYADINNCTLNVPEGCINKYSQAKVWKTFSIIKEIDLSNIKGILNSDKNKCMVQINNHTLSCRCLPELIIFDLHGNIRYKACSYQGEDIRLPKGIYIINGEKHLIED